MRIRIVLLVEIFALLLTGCANASDSPEPATATPGIMPRLDPSPTPSGGTLPLTCQVTDLNVYVNEADRYCFAYPLDFVTGDQPFDRPNVHGPAIDEGPDPVYATFIVEIESSTAGSVREQAEEFLREFSMVDPASFSWTQVQVGGEAGWKVEPVPVMLSWRIVFIEHGGRVFRLMYWPVDVTAAQSDLDELIQTTLGSFAFLK